LGLPEGTVTFLFTDIEEHTRLWQAYPEDMPEALEAHDCILTTAVREANGHIVKTTGDGLFAVFAAAADAAQAAITAQLALTTYDWGKIGPLKVRMAMNTGEAQTRDEDYFGTAVIRAARLMSAASGGQTLLSGATAALLSDGLPLELSLIDLGRAHLKGLQRPSQVYQLQHSDLPDSFPALSSLVTQRNNLPQQINEFIGREQELAELKLLLSGDNQSDTKHRLVTLLGPGGSGKTRLSIQVASELLTEYADGVWFVDLAPITDPALVPLTAANAVGLQEPGEGTMLDALLELLKEWKCLVIVDNCEHLMEASASFIDIVLRRTSGIQIVASSREALRVTGEIVFNTPPLSTPEDLDPSSFAEWQKFDSLRLFTERAAAVNPAFRLTAENYEAVTEICRRLDGIPLALELAAARVKMLTVEEIVSRLEDRFRLLTDGNRTALPRQRTLRALIDWSWDLLSENERLLLSRLAVFAGGMTLEAVEAVCADESLHTYDILELLGELVGKSLVVARSEQGGSTWYSMLGTIRQYAHERLEESGEYRLIQDRHLDYYLKLGDEAKEGLFGPDQAYWMAHMELELDNLRAALSYALQDDQEAGMQLMTATWQFWAFGYPREGEAWMAQFLAQSEPAVTKLMADALWVHAGLTIGLYDLEHAKALGEKSLELYMQLDDKHGIGLCGFIFGALHYFQGAIEKGREQLLESLAIIQPLGDERETGRILQFLGMLEGDSQNYALALSYLQKSEALFRDLGHLYGIADVLKVRGQMAIWDGHFDEALPLLNESLSLQESLGSRGTNECLQLLGRLHRGLGLYEKALVYAEESVTISQLTGNQMIASWSLVETGFIYFEKGDLEKALGIFLQCPQLFREANAASGIIYTLEGLASLALALDQPDRTIHLLAWAESAREAAQIPRPPVEQADVERALTAARSLVSHEAFAEAYATGEAMTLDEAIAYALETSIAS
jgi:predicted ATPase/class 3 adenylate cyclase